MSREPADRDAPGREPATGGAAGLHLSRKSFLGVYELVALIACTAAVALARTIGHAVSLDTRLARLDVAVEAAVHRGLPGALHRLASVVTWAGNGPTVVALVVTVAIVLLAARRYVWLVGWLGAFAGASTLAAQFKNHYERPRPLAAYLLRASWSYSYPSGHALGSVVIYGLLAYMLVHLLPDRRRRALVVVATALLVASVSASRVLLRVHYLSDVLGGLLLGGAWLVLCILGLERARRRPWSTPAERDEQQHTRLG